MRTTLRVTAAAMAVAALVACSSGSGSSGDGPTATSPDGSAIDGPSVSDRFDRLLLTADEVGGLPEISRASDDEELRAELLSVAESHFGGSVDDATFSIIRSDGNEEMISRGSNAFDDFYFEYSGRTDMANCWDGDIPQRLGTVAVSYGEDGASISQRALAFDSGGDADRYAEALIGEADLAFDGSDAWHVALAGPGADPIVFHACGAGTEGPGSDRNPQACTDLDDCWTFDAPDGSGTGAVIVRGSVVAELAFSGENAIDGDASVDVGQILERVAARIS